MGHKQVWFLPKKLDREYTLCEKLSSIFLGNTYRDHYGRLRFKPYSIYRRFGGADYTYDNPYTTFLFGKGVVYLAYEQERFEKGGFHFKSVVAYTKYLNLSKNKLLLARSLIKMTKKV